MGSSLTDQLLTHRLHIDKDLEKFSNHFVVSDTSKDVATTKFLMKFWYDGYLFCLYLGLKLNTRKKASKKTEKSARGWMSRKKQYLYLISLLLAKPEVRIELNLDSRKNINKIDNKSLSDSIKTICDEYAFGGLQYLKDEHEKDPDLFEDPFYIKKIKEMIS